MRTAIAVAVTAALCLPAAAGAQALKTDEEKTIYALGYSQGQRLGDFVLTKAEVEILKKGLTDGLSGTKSAVDLPVYGPKIQELARSRAPAKAKADAEKSKVEKAKGQAYADAAAKEPGAQKLPSGVIFKDLKPGTGASPKATDTVKVHYKGTLIDGTKFDSSYDRNAPAEFPLNGVIKCWTEGVQKMKVGGKAKLVCPSDTAYGDSGRPSIPGGATLVFEVELLDIKGAPAAAPVQGK